jgi:hypothetical protein
VDKEMIRDNDKWRKIRGRRDFHLLIKRKKEKLKKR